MRPRYSFSSRMSKRARESPKLRRQKEKYPALVERIINQSDIILEVLDARFAKETQNTEIENTIKNQNKILLKVFNKSDLTKSIPKNKIAISCKTRHGIKKLRELIKKEARSLDKKNFFANKSASASGASAVGFQEGRAGAKKFSENLQVTIGIIGYPNTGKSSLINLLIGKSSAGTGADAGFTKGMQKLKLTKDIILLDTPGVIPEKEYSSHDKTKIAQHTIVGGRSYSQVKDPEMVIAQILQKYPNLLEKHYKINAKADSEILLEQLGKKLNLFKKRGQIDIDKTARKILRDWQQGVIRV